MFDAPESIKFSELMTFLTFICIQIENDADVLWKDDIREKNEDVATMGNKFLDW